VIGVIHNENCTATMKRMPSDFIDLTVTSPPYDDLRVYKGYDFDVEAVADALYRVTKPGGVVVWVVNDRTVDGDETGTSFRHALTFKAAGFKLWDTEIFAKNNPFPGDCGERYRGVFEYMFVFSKGAPKTFNPITVPSMNPGKAFEQARLEREGRRYIRGDKPILTADTRKASNIFYYSVGVNGDGLAQFKHPAVFPLQLAKDQRITTIIRLLPTAMRPLG
jgi:DNA modification methylase